MRWTEGGWLKRDDRYQLIYSGGSERKHGVGILVDKETARTIKGSISINERVMMIKISAKPFDINVIQVEMPTTDYDDDEVNMVYGEVEKLMKKTKNNEVTVILGDFNAKVGSVREVLTVGPFGLGERNNHRERLVEFAKTNKLMIANTGYSLPKWRLYMWTSPDGSVKNQIDYILVPNRFRNGVKQVKTYPRADCYTDHNPVVLDMSVHLKMRKVKPSNKTDFDLFITNEAKKIEYFGQNG
ncbi:craniofacial development protein 2-like [Mobula hypostoma]|uniref:craniofacial development protein 2-like n=1 Tax=Mobula hypostoma TaxID=723540 RepID=UPI002FC2AC66